MGPIVKRMMRLLAIALAMAMPVRAVAGPPGYAAILVDSDTREVLYANGADLPRHPASITKIMTLYLAFEALSEGRLRLTDQVVMSRHAAAQAPSKLGLPPGRSLSVDDAIRVMAVKSANDVAVALAERLGGSEPDFAVMMTAKARELGMRNTLFVNATGLPNAAHITTARDIATLSLAMIRDFPRYYSYFSIQTYRYDRYVFSNHNHLLGRLPGMDGIKTGYTVDAGFTLAASAVRGGHRLVAVVMGEPSLRDRDRDVTALIDTGFAVLDGRMGGQPLTVASLLAPLAHPAIRVARVAVDQGSGDSSPARKPARVVAAPKTPRLAARSSKASTKATVKAKAETKLAQAKAKAGSSAKAKRRDADDTKLASAKDKEKPARGKAKGEKPEAGKGGTRSAKADTNGKAAKVKLADKAKASKTKLASDAKPAKSAKSKATDKKTASESATREKKPRKDEA